MTPRVMAITMAMMVAMTTIRSVTNRWDHISDATSWPLMVVPRLPWRAPLSQIQ